MLKSFLLKGFYFLAFALCVQSAHAQHLLRSAETTFFENPGQRRIGVEVEFTGMTLQKAVESVVKSSGGVAVRLSEKSYGIDSETFGRLEVKIEFNEVTDNVTEEDRKNFVLEIVTEPLFYAQQEKFQGVIDALKADGAKGTDNGAAVSIQTNLEVMEKSPQEKTDILIDLLRVYYSPEHQKQISASLKVAPQRLEYVGAYSPGMMKKILSSSYRPTPREFFDDFFYRQSLELSGNARAWKLPTEEVRAEIKKMRYPIVPTVVKFASVRISSVLMDMFPDDPYTMAIEKSEWTKARPAVEFRDRNNDFKTLSAGRQAYGLWSAVKKYGAFQHDDLLSKISQVSKRVIRKIREQRFADPNKTIVFRYFLNESAAESDPAAWDFIYERQTHYDSDIVIGFLPYQSHGTKPLQIEGPSVVWHRRPYHRMNILGQSNPALIDFNVAQALENKWVEALFWEKYAPGVLPKTTVLENFEIIGKNSEAILDLLDQTHPKGWILKGVWDFGMEQEGIVSSKQNLRHDISVYLSGDFDSYRKDIQRKFENSDPELATLELKKHAGYKGWRTLQLLQNSQSTLVQELLPIQSEWRVEVMEGKVLGHLSTVDRFYYKDAANLSVADARQVELLETFAQQTVNRLPESLRGMPFSLDIAVLTDGSLRMIESNPGGNGSFISDKGKSIKAGNRFLKAPERLAKNPTTVQKGLTPVQQMNFLKALFSANGIKAESQYPGMSFGKTEIIDSEFETQKGSFGSCSQAFAE